MQTQILIKMKKNGYTRMVRHKLSIYGGGVVTEKSSLLVSQSVGQKLPKRKAISKITFGSTNDEAVRTKQSD